MKIKRRIETFCGVTEEEVEVEDLQETMMDLGWKEIPAHRVLVVTAEAYRNEFELLDGNSRPVPFGVAPALVRRRRDERLFRISDWQPAGNFNLAVIALKEL